MKWRHVLDAIKLAALIIEQLHDAGLLKRADKKQVATVAVAFMHHMEDERLRRVDASKLAALTASDVHPFGRQP